MGVDPTVSRREIKTLVGAFNKEKALVGAFSVIIQTCRPSFAAVVLTGSGQQLGSSMSSYEGCSSSHQQLSPSTFTFLCVQVRGAGSGLQCGQRVCCVESSLPHTPCMIST